MNLMHVKWPQDFRFSPRGPFGASESNGSDESKAAAPPKKAMTLDALAALVSDPGPESNESNGSKVRPQGQDFRCIRVILFGPASGWNASTDSKVGLKAGTLDAVESLVSCWRIRFRGT